MQTQTQTLTLTPNVNRPLQIYRCECSDTYLVVMSMRRNYNRIADGHEQKELLNVSQFCRQLQVDSTHAADTHPRHGALHGWFHQHLFL